MNSKKILNLITVQEYLNVPPFIYLTATDFEKIFVNYLEVNEEIEKICEEIKFTSGAFIGNDVSRILSVTDKFTFRLDIAALLQIDFPDFASLILTEKLAVRSAADNEDLQSKSFAGLYSSFLNIEGEVALKEAILKVWKSYFSRAAVMERLNNGSLNDGKRMNIIIQKMVKAIFAGVSFSINPVTQLEDPLIEYVTGLGESLVSGIVEPKSIQKSEFHFNPYLDFPHYVFDAIEVIKEKFKAQIDIEWAWDGNKLYILQVRNVTTLSNINKTFLKKSVFEWVYIYLAEDAEFNDLGDIPDYATYFRNKRRPLHLFAKQLGLPIPSAIILKFNRRGLNVANIAELLSKFKTSEIIIDAGKHLRQLIISAKELEHELFNLTTGDESEVKIIVIREYIKGDFGFISHFDAGSGSVICEGSTNGLLALNRGTSDSRIFYCNNEESLNSVGFNLAQGEKILLSTQSAQDIFGSVQLEWVSDNRTMYLLDFSKINKDNFQFSPQINNSLIISNGFASGSLLKLKTNDIVKNYSEAAVISLNDIPQYEDLNDELKNMIDQANLLKRPVVLCEKPYAALAALVPYVSGFVFKAGSVLCHLAIIIRENKIPAIASEEIYNHLLNEESYELNLFN